MDVVSICKKIAEQHEGKVLAENREGMKGARFKIQLDTQLLALRI
jgi:signal transduction histidine kinase